ncbi:MAG: ABC transporter substrate-binding protein [Pseudomonadota bacterium]
MIGFGRWRAALVATLALVAVLPARAEQISVTHWGVLMYGVPFAVAMDRGLFKQAGVDVDGILTSKGGGTTVRNVLAGGLPYGEVALSAAVAAANQGIDIKIVNAGVPTVGEILWVTCPARRSRRSRTWRARRSRHEPEIGHRDGAHHGARQSRDEARRGRAHRDRRHRLRPDGAAAGRRAGAPIMDPIWAKDSAKYRVLFYAKDLLPKMTQTVGITTSEFIKSNPDKLKAIIAGRRAGVDYLYAHPQESGAILAQAYNLDPAIAEISVRNAIDIHYWTPGAIDRAGLEAMVQGLRLIGDVEGPVDWAS